MKPVLKIINTEPREVFRLLKVDEPFFFPSWHFHPEFEIMLVLKGTGMQFVGDSMERFQEGDLRFFGRDIAHFYRSDEEYYQKKAPYHSEALVLYFREDFLGDALWNRSDIGQLKKLLSTARRGIRFNGPDKEKLIGQLKALDGGKDSLSKIIDLLSILRTMAEATGSKPLSSMGFDRQLDEKECERMNNVYQYIMNHYASNPGLEEVARVAFMSETAFCRYFKARTNKTYTRFLNEIKIGNACKFLMEGGRSISQVCFDTGFNNFTHFNSQFKRITGVTPSQYKQQYALHCLKPERADGITKY